MSFCGLFCCILALSGCGRVSEPNSVAGEPLPKEASPCDYPSYWPYSAASSRFPFLVHYRTPDELAIARQIINYLDTAWQRQIVEQGFTAPPSDSGMCGPDDRFDVFIRRGLNSCKVDIVTEEFVTPWGGRASYMQLDPWGDYGGVYLQQTIAHEFNHATHAANDWYDLPIAFEMSAYYVEQFYDGPVDVRYIKDFQMHPDWGLLRNDNYETWYMYGSALYLHFLRDFYFNGKDDFLPGLWVSMRNTPDLYVNEPNFVDAVNQSLKPLGFTFLDSVVTFARWRYYAGNHDDGAHFSGLPPMAQKVTFSQETTLPMEQITLKPLTHQINPAPIMLGSAYLEVKRDNAAQAAFQLSLDVPFDSSVKWVVQAVPGGVGGSDGELVDLSSGTATVTFAPGGGRTLVLTVLPATASDFDPNQQTEVRYPIAVKVAPL